jgi:uncharacterized membrane protein
MAIPPRLTGLLALVAVIPVTLHLVGTGQADVTSTALTIVNILLITGSLFLMFGQSGGDHTETGH